MAIRLVLADDHPIVLQGLESLFRLEKDLRVVASCLTGEEVLPAVRAHRPDVLVLDLRMPGKDGLAVIRELRMDKLSTRVVLLTAELDEDAVLEALRLDVRGVILKEMAPALLVRCVQTVHAGGQWVEPQSFGRALEKMRRREAGARELSGLLTPREMEIVRLLAGGRRNKEIADKLSIGEGTIKVHLHHIYEKLHIDGRLALTLFARDKGLV
jgi:two-component system, NarL family, nitrate/nitrite response regulator NarL